MTDSNGTGVDPAGIAHSARGGASQPISFPSEFRGLRQLRGGVDLMNDGIQRGLRRLISDVDALILKDAYSYSIELPSQFGTFHAVLNEQTGELLVRGGAGGIASDITLSRDDGDLVVVVDVLMDIGTTVNGDDSNAPAFESRFPFSAINSINIRNSFTPGGDDTVTLNMTNGDVIPDGGLSFRDTDGTDTIVVVADADFNLRAFSLDVAGFGRINLEEVEHAHLIGGRSGNDFTLDRDWLGTVELEGSGGVDTIVTDLFQGNFILDDGFLDRTRHGLVTLESIEGATLTGGADDTIFTVGGWTGTATLNGSEGVNQVLATRDASFTLGDTNLAISTGGSFTLQGITSARLTGGASLNELTVSGWTGSVTLRGAGGGDRYRVTFNNGDVGTYQIFDVGPGGTDNLTVNGTVAVDTITVTAGAVNRGAQSVTYSSMEQLQVNAGSGADTISIQSTSCSLIVNAGNDSDIVNLDYRETLEIDPDAGSTVIPNIPHSVIVDGVTGTADVVNVNVRALALTTESTLTTDTLTSTALGEGGLIYRNVDQLNLTFEVSADTLVVASTGAAVTTAINTGGGTDTIRLGGQTVDNIDGPVTIDAGGNPSATFDTIFLEEFEPAGHTNAGVFGAPPNAAPGAGMLSGFGMGATVNFFNTERVTVIEGPSNDFIFLAAGSPAPLPFIFGASLGGGTNGLVFQGTDQNDRIHISRRVGPDGPEVIARINGRTIVAGYQGGTTIRVLAGAGNDRVTVDASVTTWRAELFGEAGNDDLQGGPLADLLDGGLGNDFLDGADGDDELIGGPGHDVFARGSGADQIRARDGAIDVIFADLADLLELDERDLVIRRKRR